MSDGIDTQLKNLAQTKIQLLAFIKDRETAQQNAYAALQDARRKLDGCDGAIGALEEAKKQADALVALESEMAEVVSPALTKQAEVNVQPVARKVGGA